MPKKTTSTPTNGKSEASKSTPAAGTPPAAAPARRSRSRKPAATRNRKAPIDNALRLAKLVDKNALRLRKLVCNWNGEATHDQASTNNEVVAELGQVCRLSGQTLLDLDMLKQSGFAPVAGSSRHEPLPAGQSVVIKKKYWNPSIYGKTNAFEVVVCIENQVRIKSAVDPRQPQVVVVRSWVEPVDAEPVEETSAVDAIPPDEGDPDPDPLEGDGERDPRLPNEDQE